MEGINTSALYHDPHSVQKGRGLLEAASLPESRVVVETRDHLQRKRLRKDNFNLPGVRVVRFGHVQDECPKKIDSDVVKNMKKPSQIPRGLSVDPKVGFKLVKQVFRQVSKKNNDNTSGNKKKDAEPTLEVSNSNLFDVLNSVENDVDLGTNGGTLNLASKKATSSGSSFRNVTLVNDEGKPLIKVNFSGDHDSEDEVASVDNDMTNFMASKKDSYGTNSLLEQWKESYANGDYDFDPYDDDMYEGQDILTTFKIYAIIWISKFEVVRKNSYSCFFCSLVTLCIFLYESSFAYVTGGDVRLTLILCT
ncbi:hypothetical protein Tco_1402604 [Tanacetum coccineum]